jgi:nicotinamidase-related amidase
MWLAGQDGKRGLFWQFFLEKTYDSAYILNIRAEYGGNLTTMKTATNNGSPFISRDDCVLVIIDMQERLVPAVCQNEKIVANAKRLIALATIMNFPVIVTEQGKLGSTLPELSELVASFDPVSKMTFNCFGTDEFNSAIAATGRNTLIITGIEAHICVTQTALWAQGRYGVQVVNDAISSRVSENVSVAVERMRASGVTITSTEMIIYELLEQAGTDQFKTMLPYVK